MKDEKLLRFLNAVNFNDSLTQYLKDYTVKEVLLEQKTNTMRLRYIAYTIYDCKKNTNGPFFTIFLIFLSTFFNFARLWPPAQINFVTYPV